jgi:hypothetical protein
MPDPAAKVRSLVRQGHVGHALETALSAALANGKAALEPYVRAGPPATADEGARRFLLAVQAAAEELDRLALAVVEGDRPEG